MAIPIIDKVNALLNQTEAAGCTQAEAETAFKMAQSLMTKYRISKADVGLDEDHDREKVHNEHTPLYTGKRVITWKAILASALCKANGCRLYYEYGPWEHNNTSRRSRNVYFKAIGRDTDIAVIQQMYRYLEQKVESMCNAQLIVRRRNGMFTGKNWTNSFKLGSAQTLAERVMAGEKEARDEADPTALVVLDTKDQEVEACSAKMKLGKRKLNYSRVNPAAYTKGSKASKRIAIQ